MSASFDQALGPPERLTISTCIGCGAMSVPGECAGGCGPERKLELVAGSDLDEVIDLERGSERRCKRLTVVLTWFLDSASTELPDEVRRLARAALRAHEQEAPVAEGALAEEAERLVSWWCEQCGGLDAPQPCLGVCVRRSAQWASAEALDRRRTSAKARLQREQRLACVVRALLLSRPRRGEDARHLQALRGQAEDALTPGHVGIRGLISSAALTSPRVDQRAARWQNRW